MKVSGPFVFTEIRSWSGQWLFRKCNNSGSIRFGRIDRCRHTNVYFFDHYNLFYNGRRLTYGFRFVSEVYNQGNKQNNQYQNNLGVHRSHKISSQWFYCNNAKTVQVGS